MRILGLILCIFATAGFRQGLSAQNRHLCEQSDEQYSVCYELHPDGTFRYYFTHCNGIEFGAGDFKETARKFVFRFRSMDSLMLRRSMDPSIGDSLRLELRDLTDGSPMRHARVSYAGVNYRPDSAGMLHMPYTGGAIRFRVGDKETLRLNPAKEGWNRSIVKVPYPGYTFVVKGKKLRLHKKGDVYRLRERIAVFDERTQHYRSRKRVVTYKLESGR